ncbi:MAG TPA: LysR family transcriptional regulator [Burkholderiaceae bacterium]|jgi:DNA-binding transcriptional LysR family regulator|nr:LysR family transcriptional regulator [Burkholderiaceae bacterium]
MNSDDLALFLRVANTGNYSRASLDLVMSQSVLSRRITALENELNTRLFHRSGRGVILTENGHRLAKYAADIVELLQSATSNMSEAVRQGPSSIIIAAQPSIARIVFGSVAKKLKADYPGIQIRFREGLGGHIQDWIATGEVDAAIVYLPENHLALGVDVVLRERLSFVTPPGFPLHDNVFPVEQLSEVPMVLPSQPHGLRVLAESLVARFSKSLQISMECDASIYITKQLVAEGCGCTILPLASVQDEVRRGVLKAAPLVMPDVIRDVAIILPRNRPPIAGQRQVTQTIRQEIARLVESGQWGDATLV